MRSALARLGPLQTELEQKAGERESEEQELAAQEASLDRYRTAIAILSDSLQSPD